MKRILVKFAVSGAFTLPFPLPFSEVVVVSLLLLMSDNRNIALKFNSGEERRERGGIGLVTSTLLLRPLRGPRPTSVLCFAFAADGETSGRASEH